MIAETVATVLATHCLLPAAISVQFARVWMFKSPLDEDNPLILMTEYLYLGVVYRYVTNAQKLVAAAALPRPHWRSLIVATVLLDP